MRRSLFLFAFVALLLSSSLEAGFFGDFFGGEEDKKSDVVIESEPLAPAAEEEIIIEEETISAEEYLDSSEEPSVERAIEEEPLLLEEAYPKESALQREKAVKEEEIEDFYTPKESYEEDPFIRQKDILLSFTQKPEKIYLRQHFPVKVEAIIPQVHVKAIQTEFIGGKDYKVLNPDSPWLKTGENSYENLYYLKLLSPKAKLPTLKVTDQLESGRIQSERLTPFTTKIVSLRDDALFCGVIARDLVVNKHQERKYDENSNIVVFDINATGANLEDFHIPFALREGIDEIKSSGTKQRIYYFAVVENAKKRFKFKYFNLRANKFEVISFDIRPVDTTISTHTALNPQKNKYIIYKAIALSVVALLFLILFFKYKKLYYLLFSIATVAFLFYTQVPITKAKLPKNVALRILPMQNSTVFFRTKEPIEVDILLKKENYTKVLLPNKKIGWIKNEDIR